VYEWRCWINVFSFRGTTPLALIDPAALADAIAEAEKAETEDNKKEAIAKLRTFILDNLEAFRDYRERLQEKGVETGWMRPMGSAESNMNFFSKALRKWVIAGL